MNELSASLRGCRAGLLMVGLALSVACSEAMPNKKDEKPSVKAVQARVAKVVLKTVQRDVDSVGTLYPLEEVTVSSEVEGRVERVLVDVGDRVIRGQPIVEVSPAELELTLRQQQASLRQARARLGLTDEEEDLVDVGNAAEVKKAAADLNDAKLSFQRAETLLGQGLIPRGSFDEIEARYKSAQAAYDLAVQQVQNLRAQLAQNRASLDLAKKKLSDTVIRAPFGGEVKERQVTPGQYLKVQTPVMVIVNIDPVRVRLKVPEKMASWVRVGQTVSVAVEAQPERVFQGTVSRINPSVDPTTRSFEVEALLANHEGLLKPGFFVKATIPSDRRDSALFVPDEALQYIYGVYKVYAIEQGLLKEKPVKIGNRSGNLVEVVEGVSEGERLALPGKGQELKDAAPVEIVE